MSGNTGPSVADSLLAAHPPVGGRPVTLPALVKGWTTQVWYSTDGELCSVSFSVLDAGADGGTCAASTPGQPPVPSISLQFTVDPGAAASNGSGLAVVQGPARSVAVTMFGVTTTMALEVLPTVNGAAVEVGQGLLPLKGHHAWGTGDVSRLVALDAAGAVVADSQPMPLTEATTALLKEHPPAVGSPVHLPTVVPGWSSLAWAAAGGVYCDVSEQAGQPVAAVRHCDPDNLGRDDTTATLIGIPDADTGPAGPGEGAFRVWVRGPAATVQFTMYGHTTTVPLVPVPTLGGSPVQVALAALPLEGHSTWGGGELTRLVALDAAGTVVAQWKPSAGGS